MENLKNIIRDKFGSQYVGETLIWLSVFSLLTLSSSSYDLIRSAVLSSILTLGMIFVNYLCRFVIFPFLSKKVILLLLVSIALIALLSKGSSLTIEYISDYFSEKDVITEDSLLDIQLPSENRSFFEVEKKSENNRISLSSGWMSCLLYMGSYLYALILYFRRRTAEFEHNQNILVQEKTQMELNFLRSQINPHFLFNALNNIYSMIYTGDKRAADCLLSLSEMLRYVTYESKENQILLMGEVSYLENYIEFQRFSYENEIDVTFQKSIQNERMLIAPMLLQPLVENAFKYSGIGLEKGAYIRLKLETDEKNIFFSIENTVRKRKVEDKTKRGIGIGNVKKRLDLLYFKRYSLDIEESSDVYKLNLSISVS